MRIRTQKDVDKLELHIRNQFDIDVRKYRNEEVVEAFVDLLVFPEYVMTWVIRPVLIALLFYFIGFYALDLVHVEYFIYAVIGLGLFFSSGIFLGLIFLLDRMKGDMYGIIDYSIDILKEALEDLKQANQKITDENRKDSVALLFKGILHIVSIPLLSKAISQKIPFFGGVVNRVVKKILILVSDRIKFDENALSTEHRGKDDSTTALDDYTKGASISISGLEKILNVTFKIAKYPLIFGFAFSFSTLLLFIYLIN